MKTSGTVQLGEICERLGVRERDARYVLEQGYIPKGVAKSPESGNYRQFGPGQAFWLAMVLKLKQCGIQTPLAAKIATYAEGALRTVTQNLGWEWTFLPAKGWFDTEHQYFVEIAELKYIRFGTDASPSRGGRIEYLSWHRIDKPGVPVNELRPCVVIRLDLSEIARLLSGAYKKNLHDGA